MCQALCFRLCFSWCKILCSELCFAWCEILRSQLCFSWCKVVYSRMCFFWCKIVCSRWCFSSCKSVCSRPCSSRCKVLCSRLCLFCKNLPPRLARLVQFFCACDCSPVLVAFSKQGWPYQAGSLSVTNVIQSMRLMFFCLCWWKNL